MRYKEVCTRRDLLGLAAFMASSNFTFAFGMKPLGSQTLALCQCSIQPSVHLRISVLKQVMLLAAGPVGQCETCLNAWSAGLQRYLFLDGGVRVAQLVSNNKVQVHPGIYRFQKLK